ncbi:MAG: phosphate ABC transporter substrate-binding protein PstS [Acidobacteria bacterium]|jgi:phosphate transport system substrate-binding protein|nr:phosphate ABC transporter substrate-binding protein PstS [Acidobacteriota bacterium]
MFIKTILSNKIIGIFLIFIVALGLACSGQPVGQSNGTTNSGGAIRLQGSGSTFVKPMMDKWTSEYGKLNPNIRIDYQSTGSGAGIKTIQNQTAEFGASDAAMTDDELKQAPDEIIHIPVVLGAVVITYNLESVKQPLRLSPELIADIYLGKIKKWDDEKIKRENPNVQLPATDIVPVFRADGSGTSDIFTDFLSKTNPEWKEKIGRTKNPQLPQGVGLGGKGNEGVMGQVKQTPNAIGYVELTFAKANNLPTALVKNSSGSYIEPNDETVSSAAAAMASKMPDDLRFEITNAEGADAYPISGIVYVLAYKDQRDAAKGKALADFLWWAIHDGEKFTKDLHYAPLPDEVVRKAEAKINSMTSGGKPLRQ